MAKQISGERSLKAGDETYTLRLDFEAMSSIEDYIDGPLLGFLNSLGQGVMPKLSVISFILGALAKIETSDAWRLIQEVGLYKAMEAITDVLKATLDPEGLPKGNPKARPAPK